MIRLLIKDYTLQEKKMLYDLLGTALYDAEDYGCSDLVLDDLQKALEWLYTEIKKEETGNGQNS